MQQTHSTVRCMNRAVALHNIQYLCPPIATYLLNTYRSPTRLFVSGGGEILSREGTTQGDPLAMHWYSVNTVMLINELSYNITNVKQVWLADDAVGAGKLHDLQLWYKRLIEIGKRYGYFVKESKCWLIVKSQQLENEAKKTFGKTVNISSEGMRHLGSVIGSENYREKYCGELVNNWVKQLKNLCDVAVTQPQAAYTAYAKGFKSKFTYYLRTIENIESYIEPVDTVISEQFLPTLFGLNNLSSGLHSVLSLKPSDGGLGIPCLAEEAKKQFESSVTVSKIHVNSILHQETIMQTHDSEGNNLDCLKSRDRTKKENYRKQHQKSIIEVLPPETKPFVIQAAEKGASSWLNAIPLQDQNLNLNKEQFNDALRLRYNIPLDNLPSRCACGEVFDVNHALSCKKGGFITRRHDSLKDLLTVLLDKVCVDVQSEPHLLPVTDEIMRLKSANTEEGARLDMKARGFWRRGQTAFYDIRVTHVNSKTNSKKSTRDIFREHEEAKKREYLERVLEVEHASFTPLVFGTNGGMGKECQHFINTLAEKLSKKQNEDYPEVISWLRVRLSMEILRSTILCVRGSRTPFRKLINAEIAQDFCLDNAESNIFI